MVLTAAHCICAFLDIEPDSPIFCTPTPATSASVNQIIPYSRSCSSSISVLSVLEKLNIPVPTNQFNEIALKVGSRNINHAITLCGQKAFVMEATAFGNKGTVQLNSYDVGIVISEVKITARCPCAETILLPPRYHI